MQYNENNLPILKYLRWRNQLINHPEFIKARKKALGWNTKQLLTQTPYPFLIPKSIPLDQITFMLHYNDAVMGLSRIWPEFAEAASNKIEAISYTFLKAMESSYDAFLKEELFKELENQVMQGTLIFPNGNVICYDFIMQSPEQKDGDLIYNVAGNAIKLEEGKYLICDTFENLDIDGNPEKGSSWHDFNKLEWNEPVSDEPAIKGTFGEFMDKVGYNLEITENVNENVFGMFDLILVYHLFKKYAPINEVISVRERKEHKDLPNIKTNQHIDYYDCTWYTTIIRNKGFNVRGHFRLQPCGKGNREKKLIYIHEYQKHGYVRRARLLVNQMNEQNSLD